MAKTSLLNLIKRVLRRINQDAVTVDRTVGHAQIIQNLINEAQLELFAQADWYSLYTTATITTVASTGTYALESDHGRTINLIDETNNTILVEDVVRCLDKADPDQDSTGTPTHFAIQGEYYRLYPIPAGVYTLRTRYWKIPDELNTDAGVSDLPYECENLILYWAWAGMLEYMNKFEAADRVHLRYASMLKKAMVSNKRKIDRMRMLQEASRYTGLRPPRLPSNYPSY